MKRSCVLTFYYFFIFQLSSLLVTEPFMFYTLFLIYSIIATTRVFVLNESIFFLSYLGNKA